MRNMSISALLLFLTAPAAFARVPAEAEGSYPVEADTPEVDVELDEIGIEEVELDDDLELDEDETRGEEFGAVTQEMANQIPRDMLPPAGACRVWDPYLEPGMEQMRPMYCADAWLLVQSGQWVVEHPTERLTIVHVPAAEQLGNRERFSLNED